MKMKRSIRILVFGWSLLGLFAAGRAVDVPQWWHTRGLVNTNLPSNDHAPANVGQLKNVAYQTWVEVTNRIAQVGTNGNYVSKTGDTITGSLRIASNLVVGTGTANGQYAVAEGAYNSASGNYSHAEGYESRAIGRSSHAEGEATTARGEGSHAEGYGTEADGLGSHAEGDFTTASGGYSHAEGSETTANGGFSHAEGYGTTASGAYSHAEGYGTVAGHMSHAAGYNAQATNDLSYVWSSGDGSYASIGSTTTKQYTVYAKNGIRLLGGPVEIDGKYKLGYGALTGAQFSPQTGLAIQSTGGNGKLELGDSGELVSCGDNAFVGCIDREHPDDVTKVGGFYKWDGVWNLWSAEGRNVLSVADNGDVAIGSSSFGTHSSSDGLSTIPAKFYVAADPLDGIRVANPADSNNGIGLIRGTGDGASTTVYNGALESWYGIAFRCKMDGLVRQAFNTRNGDAYFAGNVGIGIGTPQVKLDVAGTIRGHRVQITGGADLAEPFDIRDSDVVKPGLVMVIDPEHPSQLMVSQTAYDRRVVGIVSGAGGIEPAMIMSQDGTLAQGEHPIALAGRVYCYADAACGAIEPGDMLTTSDTPGYAMKVSDYTKAYGSVIGKAMTALKEGQGLVLVVVTQQ